MRLYKKRGMGWLIALGEPNFKKPAKIKEKIILTPHYDYVI